MHKNKNKRNQTFRLEGLSSNPFAMVAAGVLAGLLFDFATSRLSNGKSSPSVKSGTMKRTLGNLAAKTGLMPQAARYSRFQPLPESALVPLIKKVSAASEQGVPGGKYGAAIFAPSMAENTTTQKTMSAGR